jgi:hypothetical protein
MKTYTLKLTRDEIDVLISYMDEARKQITYDLYYGPATTDKTIQDKTEYILTCAEQLVFKAHRAKEE